ncbi:zinc ribbon domain-containing protein [Chloroflexus sp.]|uniref:zinc ribbon domain-containing protein n=1 Tax=Chloroflexus sp. TaxID=1904827 RepID=UPI00260F8C02|nr:zinc ribbon domain-containing protein [uncultured Chloroflexus sp.]
MVERICPACRHGNPLENRYCGACGAALTGADALAPREPGALAPRQFPLSSAQMRQLGAALALGAATLALEAGKAWLRRRMGTATTVPAHSITTGAADPITVPTVTEPITVTTTIISQRVVEIWERGELVRQVVERHVWRRE